MIETKLFGVNFAADFTFFATAAMFIFLDKSGFALLSMLVCIIHECGHLAALLITRHRPESIMLRCGGAKIGLGSSDTSWFVLTAGSAVNITVFLLLYFIFPKNDIYMIMFAVLNLAIGLFNLLPLGCLDGKRLLELLLPQKAANVIEVITLVVVILGIAAMFLYGNKVNFTLLAAILYVFCVDLFFKST